MWPSQCGCVIHKALLMEMKKKIRHCASEGRLSLPGPVFLSLTRLSNQRGSITEGKFVCPTQVKQTKTSELEAEKD